MGSIATHLDPSSAHPFASHKASSDGSLTPGLDPYHHASSSLLHSNLFGPSDQTALSQDDSRPGGESPRLNKRAKTAHNTPDSTARNHRRSFSDSSNSIILTSTPTAHAPILNHETAGALQSSVPTPPPSATDPSFSSVFGTMSGPIDQSAPSSLSSTVSSVQSTQIPPQTSLEGPRGNGISGGLPPSASSSSLVPKATDDRSSPITTTTTTTTADGPLQALHFLDTSLFPTMGAAEGGGGEGGGVTTVPGPSSSMAQTEAHPQDISPYLSPHLVTSMAYTPTTSGVSPLGLGPSTTAEAHDVQPVSSPFSIDSPLMQGSLPGGEWSKEDMERATSMLFGQGSSAGSGGGPGDQFHPHPHMPSQAMSGEGDAHSSLFGMFPPGSFPPSGHDVMSFDPGPLPPSAYDNASFPSSSIHDPSIPSFEKGGGGRPSGPVKIAPKPTPMAGGATGGGPSLAIPSYYGSSQDNSTVASSDSKAKKSSRKKKAKAKKGDEEEALSSFPPTSHIPGSLAEHAKSTPSHVIPIAPALGKAPSGEQIMTAQGGLMSPTTTQLPNLSTAAAEARAQSLSTDEAPRRQRKRFTGDNYTPGWVRYIGLAKEGCCEQCSPPKWLQLKNSAYWYHKQFFHGVSSVTGAPFFPPLETRMTHASDPEGPVEGLCHQCRKWVPVSSGRRKNTVLWFRHAHKCHVYQKPKADAAVAEGGEGGKGAASSSEDEGHVVISPSSSSSTMSAEDIPSLSLSSPPLPPVPSSLTPMAS